MNFDRFGNKSSASTRKEVLIFSNVALEERYHLKVSRCTAWLRSLHSLVTLRLRHLSSDVFKAPTAIIPNADADAVRLKARRAGGVKFIRRS